MPQFVSRIEARSLPRGVSICCNATARVLIQINGCC